MSNPQTGSDRKPLVPAEGWHVLHQIYTLDRGLASAGGEGWQCLREGLKAVDASVAAMENGQILWFSVVGRADFGFMIMGSRLDEVDALEKRVAAIGHGMVRRHFSFLSLTEESEYTTTEEEFGQSLERDEGLAPGTDEFASRIKAFNERMAKYRHERIYPKLGDWEAICFYPMAKRRASDQNWYALPYEERRRLMAGHARVGRSYAGRVKQLITGATGLSDWEWGVTLFSRSVDEFKKIIYEMRFDPVSHSYAEFGPFYLGQILSVQKLTERLCQVEEVS
ncbi:MAG: heme-dependent peroxidase [Candidatus Methylacidiphilales bacterium]